MVRIYGNSDDQVYVERDGTKEQITAYRAVSFLIGDATGGAIVRIDYGTEGAAVWRIEVSQIDEGIALPWPLRFENVRETDHSLAVVIECPPGTPCEKMAEEKGKGT